MKNNLIRYFLFCLSFALACNAVFAQNDTLSAAAGDRYVISAKAGGINFVEGVVNVTRKVGKSGQLLRGDTLEIGDRVTTGSDGKVEILLNPGSFLRLGGDTTFEFKTTSLDDLRLRIERGSAILEIYAADEFAVNVATPARTFSLTKSGVYRVDVPAKGNTRLKVWKGVANVAGERVKPGKAAVADGSAVSVAKFDRDQKDSLDEWSKLRSKELATIAAKLKRQDVEDLLRTSFLAGRWGFMRSFGLWIFDPRINGYFFLPFGAGWNSPYGFGYGNGMWWWDMPYWYQPWQYPTNTGGGTSTGGGSTTPTPPASTPIRSAGDRSPIPPFVRMEILAGGGVHGGGPGRGGYNPSSSGSSPSFTPSYSSPSSSPSSSSAPSAPPSTGAKSDPTGTKP